MASWTPGQSGNPNGRTPNEKSFTYALRKALCENNFEVKFSNGETLAETPRDIVAGYMAQAMVTGEVKLVTGQSMKLSPKDWWEVIWQGINRVDGAPLQQIDANHTLEQIVFDAPQTLLPPQDQGETIEVEAIEVKEDEVV